MPSSVTTSGDIKLPKQSRQNDARTTKAKQSQRHKTSVLDASASVLAVDRDRMQTPINELDAPGGPVIGWVFMTGPLDS